MILDNKVPCVAYDQALELFDAAQQLALVALLETPEDEEAVGIPGALAWAQNIRAQWNKADMLRALVQPSTPNQNTNPEFMEFPLRNIPYPGPEALTLNLAFQKFCAEVSEGQHQDLVRGLRFIKEPEKTLAIMQGYQIRLPHRDSPVEITLKGLANLLERVGWHATEARCVWLEKAYDKGKNS